MTLAGLVNSKRSFHVKEAADAFLRVTVFSTPKVLCANVYTPKRLCFSIAVPMLPHRRKAPRRRVLKTGSIEFADTAIECTVRNMSATGAAIEVVTPLFIPDRFTLFIQSEQSRRACRVVWRSGRRMGVAFQ